jgi:hypothetical protein
MSLLTPIHIGKMSPTSASHVGDQLLAFASHVGSMSPAVASHAGGIDTVENPRCIGRNHPKPKFPCNVCKGDHLTHLCPAISMVQRTWSLSEGPSSSVSSLVSQ